MVLSSLAWVDDPGRAAGLDAVVLLPSLGTTSTVFTALIGELVGLMPNVVPLRLDLPGHGAGPVAGPVSVEGLASELAAEVAGMGASSVLVVGVSFGGAIALEAARSATAIRGFVMINSGARFGDPASWRSLIAEVEQSGVAGLRESSARGWFSEAFRSDPAAVRILDLLADIDAATYIACCRALESYRGDRDLGAIRSPGLLIGTADDRATPSDGLRSLAARMSDSEFHQLPHGGHLSVVEHASVIASLLADWSRRRSVA
jgi:pimeloyl-ACP methyl ester carboxylesterase